MSVISLNALKARFSSGDMPSQKDFEDLIDTLWASGGTAVPSGPAGGDLSGSYPNPVIAGNAVTYAKLQQATSGKLLGRWNPGTGTVEEIGVAGPDLGIVGGNLTYLAGGGGGSGAGTVAGTIDTYQTADTMPNRVAFQDGTGIVVQAPVEFGSSMPQVIRVVAVCHQARANYVANDEVPIDHFRINDGTHAPAITWAAYVTGGQVTVRIKAEYGQIATSSGIAVFDRDSAAATEPTLVPFATGSEPEDFFYLKVYFSRFEYGSGFGSIALFEPADQAIPIAGSAVTFTHNFGALPMQDPMVALVCAIDESAVTGHAIGDVVPISTAFETGFANPAFGVTISTSTVIVRREASTIQIPHKTSGALTSITAASWQIRVRAARGVNLPSTAFPALTYMVSNPMCAWSYNNMLYVIHYDDDAASSFLCQIDMTTNQVVLLTSFSPPSYFGNLSMFRMDDGGTPVDCIFLCDTRGIHRFRMDTLTWTTLRTGYDERYYKVVDVDTTALGGFAHPDMLVTYAAYGGSNTVNAMAPQKLIWGGASYTIPGGVEDQINWAATAGVSGSYATYQTLDQNSHPILFFQYNPIKRRIYLLHAGSGYLSIFTLLPGPTSLYDWWDSSVDGTKLEHTKMLALSGGGDTWTDTGSEKMFVEFDGLTGQERAFVLVRRGNSSLTGSVCRIPWTE